MYAAGRNEIEQMDQYTINTIGLPGAVLMENAGAKVALEIMGEFPCQRTKIIVFAGPGNNGGDGFVISRRLQDSGYDCLLYLAAAPDRIKGDAKIHFDVYRNRELPIMHYDDDSFRKIPQLIEEADVVVDALLGTGVNGPVREPFIQLISMINHYEKSKKIISVDIPSGVNSDTGKVDGLAVKATKTITFVYPKKGFFLQDGPNYIGDWKAVDISVPPSIVSDISLNMPTVITDPMVQDKIPKRPIDGHKGTFGHVLVLGGSRPYVGAPIFTAKSSLLSGTGLVTMAVPENIYPLAAAQLPEALYYPLAETDGHFSEGSLDELSTRFQEYDVVAVGPGMNRFREGEKWMEKLFRSLTGQTIVVDADALYLSRNLLEPIRKYGGEVIFTPHPGEMGALLNITAAEVEGNRLEIASAFAKKNDLYLLLKGHRSIIASPLGEVFINPAGHDALGKGGSGDVLTGLIASFAAQGAKPLDAMIAASYLHARAGEEKAKTLSHYGVIAPDLIDGVRELLNSNV